jgi:hypothetical protein
MTSSTIACNLRLVGDVGGVDEDCTPRSSTSSATFRAASSTTSLITTFAPASASAKAIDLRRSRHPLPVIIATCPASSCNSRLPLTSIN